jgi:V/A-type H+/Na+-transporting ATPase subunit D
MARINPTRINLINSKKEIRIARKGHSLLTRKREVLVLEFMKLLKLSGADRKMLEEMLSKAYDVVAVSSAYVGDFSLNASAANLRDSTSVKIAGKNIMGVKVPEIDMTEESMGPNDFIGIVGSSAATDDITDAFSEVKRVLVEIVKREQGLRRLVLEIDKTKRRVNALEYVMIPRIVSQSRYIAMRLEEMDRDTFSALKHVKKRLAAAQEVNRS